MFGLDCALSPTRRLAPDRNDLLVPPPTVRRRALEGFGAAGAGVICHGPAGCQTVGPPAVRAWLEVTPFRPTAGSARAAPTTGLVRGCR